MQFLTSSLVDEIMF